MRFMILVLVAFVLNGCVTGDDSTRHEPVDPMWSEGPPKAVHTIAIHANPVAGQFWEMSSEAYGTKTTDRWQVVNVDGNGVIVEYQMRTDSEYMMSDYLVAFQVDLTVAPGEANVTKAWIGKPGEAGKEIQVMEKPEPVASGGTTNYEVTEDDFTDVEMAGGNWSGKLVTIRGDGWESKTWTATNGWFHGVIKMETSGMVTQLTAFGTDAKPLLKW